MGIRSISIELHRSIKYDKTSDIKQKSRPSSIRIRKSTRATSLSPLRTASSSLTGFVEEDTHKNVDAERIAERVRGVEADSVQARCDCQRGQRAGWRIAQGTVDTLNRALPIASQSIKIIIGVDDSIFSLKVMWDRSLNASSAEETVQEVIGIEGLSRPDQDFEPKGHTRWISRPRSRRRSKKAARRLWPRMWWLESRQRRPSRFIRRFAHRPQKDKTEKATSHACRGA